MELVTVKSKNFNTFQFYGLLEVHNLGPSFLSIGSNFSLDVKGRPVFIAYSVFCVTRNSTGTSIQL